MSIDSPMSLLQSLFGDNRAEFPPDQFRELFVVPTYFASLEGKRPALLIGGRGTGKTTTLRSLRFDAATARLVDRQKSFVDLPYIGVFVRMNKNRVHAFQGSALEESDWSRAFAHYINLLLCDELSAAAEFIAEESGATLADDDVAEVCRQLGFPEVNDVPQLRRLIRRGITALELFVNNPRRVEQPVLSMAEAPVIRLAQMLFDGPARGRMIFCCIDEYENLLDSQQAVLNTYVKHAEPPISYKLGLRQNGLRTRHTLDSGDLLSSPDDYREIRIAEDGFTDFAIEVANRRLNRAAELGIHVGTPIESFLPTLSFAKEAELLGASRVATQVREELSSDESSAAFMASKADHELYFLKYWSQSSGLNVVELANDWRRNPDAWQTRLGNYGYASLFWLSKGRKGARIRKYYCGKSVQLALSGGNIRYFLELIDAGIRQQGLPAAGPNRQLVLSAKAQTVGARTVGERKLRQLEGVARDGVKLKRLVLAIGKAFFELARSPLGKTPEVTSFVITGEQEKRDRLRLLLDAGVAHLAFQVTPRTKSTSTVEMKDDEFRLHPIFCPFFEISHRRKRRITFDAADLLEVLGDHPGRGIAGLLSGEQQSPEEELPQQLALFSTFFGAMGQ